MACEGCGLDVWSGITPLFTDDFESYAGDQGAFSDAGWIAGHTALTTTRAFDGTWSIGNVNDNPSRAISPDTTTIVFAMEVYWTEDMEIFGEGALNLTQGATHNGFNSQCSIFFMSGGSVRLTRSSSAILIAESAAGVLNVNAWNCVTGALTVAEDGAYKIYVNGDLVLDGEADLQALGTSVVGGASFELHTLYYVDSIWLATAADINSAIHCPDSNPIQGSLVAGVKTTVKATRAVAFGLDDNTNVHDTPGMLKVFGDVWITGNLTVEGTTTIGSAEPTWGIVTAGDEIVFADGDIVTVTL